MNKKFSFRILYLIFLIAIITIIINLSSAKAFDFNLFKNGNEGYFQKIESDFPVNGNAVKLKDGRILITTRPDNIIFDPKTNKFRKTTPFNDDIQPGMGILLNNGKVLFIGPIVKQPSEKFLSEIYAEMKKEKSFDGSEYRKYRKLPEEEKKKKYMPILEKNPELMKKYNELIAKYESSMYAQLYNPDTEKFEYSAGKTRFVRWNLKKTILQDEKVLIMDGFGKNAELYNPLSNSFELLTAPETPSLLSNNIEPITLNDGRVILIGANYTIYDPVKNYYSKPKPFEKKYKKLLKLKDGRILIFTGDNSVFNSYRINNPPESLTGGANANVYMYTWQQFNAMGIKIYDPVKDEISTAGHLAIPRGDCSMFCFNSVLLQDGRVLITGGQKNIEKHKLGNPITDMDEAEIFNLNTGKSKMITKMNYKRVNDKLILLDDGRVLLYSGNGVKGNHTELYIPKRFKN